MYVTSYWGIIGGMGYCLCGVECLGVVVGRRCGGFSFLAGMTRFPGKVSCHSLVCPVYDPSRKMLAVAD